MGQRCATISRIYSCIQAVVVDKMKIIQFGNFMHKKMPKRSRWWKLAVLQPVKHHFLLLKVTPVFLVDENKIEIVSHGEFLVDVPECRRQLKSREE